MSTWYPVPSGTSLSAGRKQPPTPMCSSGLYVKYTAVAADRRTRTEPCSNSTAGAA